MDFSCQFSLQTYNNIISNFLGNLSKLPVINIQHINTFVTLLPNISIEKYFI